jgi:hypothetical protein
MTYQRYNYTARLFDWSEANDANGTLVYQDKGDVSIEFATDPNAPRVIIYSPVPLRKRTRLASIRNHRGDYIMGATSYTITSIEPLITVFGDLEGYRMHAALDTEAF